MISVLRSPSESLTYALVCCGFSGIASLEIPLVIQILTRLFGVCLVVKPLVCVTIKANSHTKKPLKSRGFLCFLIQGTT